jgi:hypothetical protein
VEPAREQATGASRALRAIAEQYAEGLQALLGSNLVSIALYGSVLAGKPPRARTWTSWSSARACHRAGSPGSISSPPPSSPSNPALAALRRQRGQIRYWVLRYVGIEVPHVRDAAFAVDLAGSHFGT